MKIALVSLNQVWEDKSANLFKCEQYIQRASEYSVDLIVFPEMTLTGFSTNVQAISEEPHNTKTVEIFAKLAQKFTIATVFGVVIHDGEKALNQLVFIDKKGVIRSKYSKIHPFSFAEENKFFSSGNKLAVVDFQDFKIGLSICYDLRFPELYSALAKESDLVINIANWPSKRIEHWNVLLKARAIENQIFIVGVNRIGSDNNGLTYISSSNIFNANGEVLEYESIQDMQIYEIDKAWTKHFKETFNTTKDRKSDFYKEIL